MVNYWKIGYISGLAAAGSYIAGQALYDKFSVVVLPLEAAAFVFPEGKNPIRINEKRIVNGVFKRFPYYDGGFAIPLGFNPDDIQLDIILTDSSDSDDLETMLNRSLDYMGNDSFYSTCHSKNLTGTAPMILEMGYHNVNRQKLVHLDNYKIMRDSKRSNNYYEFNIVFKGYSKPVFRGI